MKIPSTKTTGKQTQRMLHSARTAHTCSCFYWWLSWQTIAVHLGLFLWDVSRALLSKARGQASHCPLWWQLNKPLSHMWLCLRKLVWFRIIWVKENIPLKDSAWVLLRVEGGRGVFPSPRAKVNSAQKEEIRAHCSHLRAFYEPKWKIN